MADVGAADAAFLANSDFSNGFVYNGDFCFLRQKKERKAEKKKKKRRGRRRRRGGTVQGFEPQFVIETQVVHAIQSVMQSQSRLVSWRNASQMKRNEEVEDVKSRQMREPVHI